MLLYFLATFCVTSTSAYRVLDSSYLAVGSGTGELQWAETYTVKATRVSLTFNIVEDFTVWKTNQTSRVDCNKGAVKYIAKEITKDSETHPVKILDGYCNMENMTETYYIKGYTKVTKYSTNAIKVAVVKHGPIYVYVDVSDEFFAYSSGIFYQSSERCDPEMLNHAVALVGYGEIDGELFFILKNSYGQYWGDDGYMLISSRDNVCGVKSNPTYPVF